MQDKDSPLVVVAGNIASGKSTVARVLSDHYNWTYLAEPAGDDAVLQDFYTNQRLWTFTLNMHLLGVRAEQLVMAMSRTEGVVIDRSIYEDVLFVDLALHLATTTARNVDIFRRLYASLTACLPAPDLLVYLEAPPRILADRARGRGRQFEPETDVAYLESLQARYDQWIDGYDSSPVLRFAVESVDLRTPLGASLLFEAMEAALSRPAT